MSKYFENPIPPQTETFGFRDAKPCRFEQPSTFVTSGNPNARQTCPYEDNCVSTAVPLRQHLPYKGRIKVVMSEPSASIVVRSESQFNQLERSRLSLRKHIFELNNDSFPTPNRQTIKTFIRKLGEFNENDEGRIEQILQRVLTESPNHIGKDVKDELANLTKNNKVDELLSDMGLYFTSGTSCVPIEKNDQFGRYLGFVDLRLGSEVSPISIGVLAPPRWLRHNPDVRLITGEYGYLFGSHGFPCSIFTMHEPELGGACCAQACIIMCLGLLADRGAKMMGSYEITFLSRHSNKPATQFAMFLAKQNKISTAGLNPLVKEIQKDPSISKIEDIEDLPFVNQANNQTTSISALLSPQDLIALKHTFQNSSPKNFHFPRTPANNAPENCLLRNSSFNFDFSIGGLVVTDAVDVLNRPQANASAKFVSLPYWLNGPHQGTIREHRIIAERLIEAYINARLPLILWLDGNTYNPNLCTGPHAITIVGYIRSSTQGWGQFRISDLVIHDPSYKAYVVCPIEKCLEASANFRDPQQQAPGNFVQMICVGDVKVKVHAFDCLMSLMQSSDVFARLDFIKAIYPTSSEYDSLATNDMSGLRISLTHRDEIAETYPEIIDSKNSWTHTEKQRLEIDWYWCVSKYIGNDLQSLWIFNRSRPKIAPNEYPQHDVWFSKHSNFAPMFTTASHSSTPAKIARDNRLLEKPTASRVKNATQNSGFQLAPSFLTSSSDRSLKELLLEIKSISNQNRLDLFVARNRDVLDCGIASDASYFEKNSSAQTLSDMGNLKILCDWYAHEIPAGEGLIISAFATYFPEITRTSSSTQALTNSGRTALSNSVRLALRLRKARPDLFVNGNGIVVEIVCGTIVDRCNCSQCKSDVSLNKMVHVAHRKEKIKLLLESLNSICQEINSDEEFRNELDWCFAIELEPGETFVVNDFFSLKEVCDTVREKYGTAPLRKHFGINVDIAHMRMAGILKHQLRGFQDWIANAHICDHPNMHTRDQKIGRWNSVDRYNSEDYGYLLAIKDAFRHRQQTGAPQSGSVGLELEGCNRISWILESLISMKQMMQTLTNHESKIRRLHSL